MLRIALIVVLFFVADLARAYPASPQQYFQTGGVTYTSVSAAIAGYCTGKTSCGDVCRSTSGMTTGTQGTLVSCAPTTVLSYGGYILYQDNPPTASWYAYSRIQRMSDGGNTCPNGGTLSGSTCTCAAGEVDTGTGCVPPQCPEAGVTAGVQNVTTGWALSGTAEHDDIVVDNAQQALNGTHCKQDAVSGANCVMRRSTSAPGAGVVACWRSTQPNPQGLYRLSCDFEMEGTGLSATCTPSAEDLNSPSATSAVCPTGQTGTVNGKPVCLGFMPASGINFGKPETPGNPRAGTSNQATNDQREPTGANGGGPDARGGPGVTVRDGATGTGGGVVPSGSGGPGTAPSLELPTDYQRDATGQTTNQKLQTIITDGLKIKEEGTPTGSGALDAAKGEYGTAADAREGGLGSVTSAQGKSTSWGWSMALPTGCTAIPVDMIYETVNVDPCEYQTVIHDLVSMLWAGTTLFIVFGMVGRTLREA